MTGFNGLKHDPIVSREKNQKKTVQVRSSKYFFSTRCFSSLWTKILKKIIRNKMYTSLQIKPKLIDSVSDVCPFVSMSVRHTYNVSGVPDGGPDGESLQMVTHVFLRSLTTFKTWVYETINNPNRQHWFMRPLPHPHPSAPNHR